MNSIYTVSCNSAGQLPPAPAQLHKNNVIFYTVFVVSTNLYKQTFRRKQPVSLIEPMNKKTFIAVFAVTAFLSVIIITPHYANDSLNNMGKSDKVFFSVNTNPLSNPTILWPIVASILVVVIAAAALVYIKTRKNMRSHSVT
jgi:hypothetical protein